QFLFSLSNAHVKLANFKYWGQQEELYSENAMDLISGQIEITPVIAKNLSKYLGASADFWLQREEQYRNTLAYNYSPEEWLKELPIKDMVKFGWIKNVADKVTECLSFFDVPDVKTWRLKYSKLMQATSFRKSPTFKTDQAAAAAWIRYGEIVAQKIECKKWNEELFESTLYELKALTRKKNPKEFIPELLKSCAECGVALVISPTPYGCKASGATKFINNEKAMLLLSFRYLSDDQFWFTFYHEAGHIVLHKSKIPIIEDNSTNVNISEEENEANIFAAEVLIPNELQRELSLLNGNRRNIINFAQKAGVSPGIVIGQMQYLGIINHKYLNSYKRRYDWEEIISLINSCYPPKNT
ncbi:MAG: ImmA/IrrE family metallo-endopeptidase, partial [Flavobacterium sp.]